MRKSDFKTALRNIENGGKDYFENYLQYCGWFFMNLTLKQTDIIYDIIVSYGYPTEQHHNRTWVCFPNGMQFSKDRL